MIESLGVFTSNVLAEYRSLGHNFEVVHQEEVEGRYLVVLDSGTLKVRVTSSLMDFTCSVGPRIAPSVWEDVSDGTRLWYPTSLLLDFIQDRVRPSKEEAIRGLDMRLESEILKEEVSNLKLIYKRLSELFEEKELKQTLNCLGVFIKKSAEEIRKIIFSNQDY